jgi:allantoinase
MLLLKDCSTLHEGSLVKRDILIDDERIKKISGDIRTNANIMNMRGLFVMPGAIDAHVHFDDPGNTRREDFEHGSRSAIAGGVTCVIDMPCTSKPPVTTEESFKGKLSVIERKAYCDFALYGGIDGADEGYIEHMRSLNDVVGFKCYATSPEGFMRLDRGRLFEALSASKKPILLHAEDNEIVEHFTKKYENSTNPMDWQRARPPMAEALAIRDASYLAHSAKGSLHLVHVSSREGAAAVEEGKRIADISAETCPQYLLLNSEHLKALGTMAKTSPPVREKKDNAFLWQSLRDGRIDFVASDHAPCEKKEKEKGIFEAYSGIPGVQTILPLMISEGYNMKRLSLERVTEITSTAPAKRYGLYPRKGALRAGSDADLVAIDLEEEWVLKNEDLLSKNAFSPFDGRKMRGRVKKTFLRGELVYDGEILRKKGRFVHAD